MKKFTSMLTLSVLTVASLYTPGWAARNVDLPQNNNHQLIVSIEKPADALLEEDDAIEAEQEKAIESKGFTIIDAMMEEKRGENGLMSKADNSFKQDVVDKMGYVYLVEYPEKIESPEAASNELKKTLASKGFEVRYIEENEDVYLEDEPSLPSLTEVHEEQKWQYDMINAPKAWEITKGNKDVKVAVIDTGIDHNHPCLSGLVDVSLGATFVDEEDTVDGHSHGTHVAGTIASHGAVSGVAENITLVPIKVFNASGYSKKYSIQNGVLHAAKINADVLNMSLKIGGYSQAMEDACNLAASKGAIIAVASGNGYKSSIDYPAAFNSCIAVGAVMSDRQRASFSNYGKGLAVMAPGYEVYSTIPNGEFEKKDGTSMASPHVAGVAALMKSVNKNITGEQAKAILKETAVPAGDSFQYGSGIVDAAAAVQKAQELAPTPSEK